MTNKGCVMLEPTALFESAVSESFTFLEQEYGFSRSTLRPNEHSVLVRYENSLLYVNLMFGPPAYESEMSFGRLGLDDVPGRYSFEAGDLIQLPGCRGWKSNAVSSDKITGQVAWLASLLRECGRLGLLNDLAFFNEMRSRREAMVAEWQRDERNSARANKIAAAWEARNYKDVVDLCSSYEGTLSNVDQKRLEFSRRRV